MPLHKKYQNNNNYLAALIMKFEETGHFCVLPEKGRKRIVNESVKKFATTVIERASSSWLEISGG